MTFMQPLNLLPAIAAVRDYSSIKAKSARRIPSVIKIISQEK